MRLIITGVARTETRPLPMRGAVSASCTVISAEPVRPTLRSGRSISGGLFPRRCEAVVEGLVLGGKIEQELRRRKARPEFLFQCLAKRNKTLGAHHIDPGNRPAGERSKTPAENRADIGF